MTFIQQWAARITKSDFIRDIGDAVKMTVEDVTNPIRDIGAQIDAQLSMVTANCVLIASSSAHPKTDYFPEPEIEAEPEDPLVVVDTPEKQAALEQHIKRLEPIILQTFEREPQQYEQTIASEHPEQPIENKNDPLVVIDSEQKEKALRQQIKALEAANGWDKEQSTSAFLPPREKGAFDELADLIVKATMKAEEDIQTTGQVLNQGINKIVEGQEAVEAFVYKHLDALRTNCLG